jgi:hypothetical protein
VSERDIIIEALENKLNVLRLENGQLRHRSLTILNWCKAKETVLTAPLITLLEYVETTESDNDRRIRALEEENRTLKYMIDEGIGFDGLPRKDTVKYYGCWSGDD